MAESGGKSSKRISKKVVLKTTGPQPTSSSKKAARFTRYSRYSIRHHDDLNVRTSLADVVVAMLEERGMLLYLQRVFVVGKNLIPEMPSSSVEKLTSGIKFDFKLVFETRIREILRICQNESFVNDSLGGLHVCMGDYSLLMVEGSEEMVSTFCQQLAHICSQLWTANRVFQVQDNIERKYFKDFQFMRSPGININEKFSPSALTDFYIMGVQHTKICEKLQIICETLSVEVSEAMEREAEERKRLAEELAHAAAMNKYSTKAAVAAGATNPTKTHKAGKHRKSLPNSRKPKARASELVDEMFHELEENASEETLNKDEKPIEIIYMSAREEKPKAVVEEEQIEKKTQPPDVLNADVYNKLLPEVQRLDLILNCSKFYKTLEHYATHYVKIPIQTDEDALIWPLCFNYTPVGIFKRSPFDFNLTFSDYGNEEEEPKDKQAEKQGNSSEEEAKEG